VFERADMEFWKMIVVPDRLQCSSFVLYYKGDSFWGASGFCRTELPDISRQKGDKTRQKRDKTGRNSAFLGRKLAQKCLPQNVVILSIRLVSRPKPPPPLSPPPLPRPYAQPPPPPPHRPPLSLHPPHPPILLLNYKIINRQPILNPL
jgi:hypothetical protein